MKKVVKVISIIIILSFVLTACKSSITNYDNHESTTITNNTKAKDSTEANETKETIKTKETVKTKEIKETKESVETKETKGIMPLTNEDFILSDGKNVLKPGVVFKNFSSPEPETGSAYVGQSYNGDQPYDVYVHYYKDFDIYISDMGKGEVPPYIAPIIIEQVSTNTAKYKTNRGISVGLSKSDVLNEYGEGKIETMDDDTRTLLEYTLGNKTLSFDLNKQDIIQSILLYLNS